MTIFVTFIPEWTILPNYPKIQRPLNEYAQRMVLGTAQLGSMYGIANRRGVPTVEEGLQILQTAWEAGIRYVDTAPAYRSEAIIGEFIRTEGIENEIRILTKIPSLYGIKEWKNFVHDSLEASFKSLGAERIEALFFHDAKDALLLFTDTDFFKELLGSFPIKALGVSVYEPNEVLRIDDCGFDLAIQFPFNLLDRRFEKNAIPRGMRFGRSVFLQGLLAGAELRENAPTPLKDLHAAISSDCKIYGISALQLCLAFVTHSDSIDFFLVGVDSPKQLNDLLNLDLTLPAMVDQWGNRWRALLGDKWLDPRQWHNDESTVFMKND